VSIEGLFKDPHDKQCNYVFYDPLQKIYVTEPSLPGEMGPPYELKRNCLNTVKIARHCEAFVDRPIPVLDNAPEGEEPEIRKVKSLDEAFRLVEKKVRALCFQDQGGLKPRQVAVLAEGGDAVAMAGANRELRDDGQAFGLDRRQGDPYGQLGTVQGSRSRRDHPDRDGHFGHAPLTREPLRRPLPRQAPADDHRGRSGMKAGDRRAISATFRPHVSSLPA
jgi:hypothetical protein